jgi:hypothetical protein
MIAFSPFGWEPLRSESVLERYPAKTILTLPRGGVERESPLGCRGADGDSTPEIIRVIYWVVAGREPYWEERPGGDMAVGEELNGLLDRIIRGEVGLYPADRLAAPPEDQGRVRFATSDFWEIVIWYEGGAPSQIARVSTPAGEAREVPRSVYYRFQEEAHLRARFIVARRGP